MARHRGAQRPSRDGDALRMKRQREMREAMFDRRELGTDGRIRIEMRSREGKNVVVERDFGQAPQSAPDAERRTLLQQDLATALEQQDTECAARQYFFRTR